MNRLEFYFVNKATLTNFLVNRTVRYQTNRPIYSSMPFFLSKIDKYLSERTKDLSDDIDLKFPAEISTDITPKTDITIFVVDDDPLFLQAINTYISQLAFEKDGLFYRFNVKNYVTGDSCLRDLKLDPGIVFLNYEINKGVKNALNGWEIVEQLLKSRPHQKIVIVNTNDDDLEDVSVEQDLRGLIVNDDKAADKLTHLLQGLLL